MPSPHALYRFFDETGRLLYVGISVDPGRRFSEHRGGKPWWEEVSNITVQPVPSREDALRAEEQAIKLERPRYNAVHNQAVTRVPIMHPEKLFDLICRGAYVARTQGGQHLDLIVDEMRRRGLNDVEAVLAAWVDWMAFYMNDLEIATKMMLAQFPFERIDAIRQAVTAQAIAHGHDVFDMGMLVEITKTLAVDLTIERFTALPENEARQAMERFTYAGEVDWAEGALEARGWTWFDDIQDHDEELSAADGSAAVPTGPGGHGNS